MSAIAGRRHGPVAGRYTVESAAGVARIRVSCERCGAYIKWAALTEDNWRRAGAAPQGRKTWLDTTDVHEDKVRAALLQGLRAARAPDDLLQLVDLLLLVGWERALRVTVASARAHAAELGCPAEYLAMLDRERASWVSADVYPIGLDPPSAQVARGGQQPLPL